MKRFITAAAICLFSLGFLAATSSPGEAGGYGYKRHFGHHHHFGHRRHYGHGYRRHYGPRFFFGFSNYGHRRHFGYRRHYPGYYAPYPRVIYRPPPVQYVTPAPVTVAPPAVQQQPVAQLPEGCRMVREYQTQITVGGKLVDAYGDACLMPDGSWERGPPKIFPE